MARRWYKPHIIIITTDITNIPIVVPADMSPTRLGWSAEEMTPVSWLLGGGRTTSQRPSIYKRPSLVMSIDGAEDTAIMRGTVSFLAAAHYRSSVVMAVSLALTIDMATTHAVRWEPWFNMMTRSGVGARDIDRHLGMRSYWQVPQERE
jgi:hypothetical protein